MNALGTQTSESAKFWPEAEVQSETARSVLRMCPFPSQHLPDLSRVTHMGEHTPMESFLASETFIFVLPFNTLPFVGGTFL